MRHLSIAKLLAFADPAVKEEEREELRKHLEVCESCRERLVSLKSFRSALSAIPESLEPFELTENCVPEELMGDFLGGRLPAEEDQKYSRHTEDCDMCFERAAFFNRSTIRMTEGVLKTGRTPRRFIEAVAPPRKTAAIEDAGGKASVWDMLSRWAASPIPAYAFAAVLLLFLITSPMSGPGKLVDLSPDATYSFYDKPSHAGPSFGFADAGRKTGEEEAGLAVNRSSENTLEFRWRDVEGADEYALSLLEITPDGLREVYNGTFSKPGATLPLTMVKAGNAYRWKISGSNGEGKIFTGTGQFVYLD